jgi:hypothetical protein
VTDDGNLLQFGKLENDCFFKNRENFTVDRLNLLYGALDHIIQAVKENKNQKERA